jgi:hypothetical protein
MSQSDYIKFKKTARILNKQKDLESVLSSNEYTNFKTFVLGNTISNQVPTYRQLQIEAQVTECASFPFCTNTNTRENRVITMTDIMGKRGYTRQHGYNEYIVNQKVNNLIMPCKMFESCDEFLYLRNNMNKTQKAYYYQLTKQLDIII